MFRQLVPAPPPGNTPRSVHNQHAPGRAPRGSSMSWFMRCASRPATSAPLSLPKGPRPGAPPPLVSANARASAGGVPPSSQPDVPLRHDCVGGEPRARSARSGPAAAVRRGRGQRGTQRCDEDAASEPRSSATARGHRATQRRDRDAASEPRSGGATRTRPASHAAARPHAAIELRSATRTRPASYAARPHAASEPVPRPERGRARVSRARRGGSGSSARRWSGGPARLRKAGGRRRR